MVVDGVTLVLPIASYSSGVERENAVAPRKFMRWYNPWLESFEWREVPDTDEEVLSLFDGCAGAEAHAARGPRGGLRGVASAGGRHNGRAHQGRRSSRGRG
jgi:hypothetical protein